MCQGLGEWLYTSGSYESPPLGGAKPISSLELHLKLITSAVFKRSSASQLNSTDCSHLLFAVIHSLVVWSSLNHLCHVSSSTDSSFIQTCLPLCCHFWTFGFASLPYLTQTCLALPLPSPHASTCKQRF